MNYLISVFKFNCLRKIQFVFFFLICIGVQSQTVRQPLMSTYPGIGAYTQNSADAFSMIINPAALANVKVAGAGVYGERRFLLSALNQYTAAIAMPTSSGSFGLQADYFGYSNFRETQIGLAYGRSLGKNVNVGVKFNYYNLNIPANVSASAFHFEAGVVMHLTEKLHAGFSAFNPVGGVINKANDEKIASVYRGGFGYEASEKFFIIAEMIKEENKNVGVNAAFQYALVKQLLIRAGINTLNSQPFIGAGLKIKQLRIDFATAYHPQLGLSPALMLLFDFSKNEAGAE
jgi:hypothetical protein